MLPINGTAGGHLRILPGPSKLRAKVDSPKPIIPIGIALWKPEKRIRPWCPKPDHFPVHVGHELRLAHAFPEQAGDDLGEYGVVPLARLLEKAEFVVALDGPEPGNDRVEREDVCEAEILFEPLHHGDRDAFRLHQRIPQIGGQRPEDVAVAAHRAYVPEGGFGHSPLVAPAHEEACAAVSPYYEQSVLHGAREIVLVDPVGHQRGIPTGVNGVKRFIQRRDAPVRFVLNQPVVHMLHFLRCLLWVPRSFYHNLPC